MRRCLCSHVSTMTSSRRLAIYVTASTGAGHNSLSSSQSVSHLGIRGIVGDCQAPIPHAGCRCGGGQAHTPGTEELCVCGVGVHVPGEAWTHHISLELLLYTHTMSGSHGATHTHTYAHSNTQKARLLFLSVHMPLWPAH